MKRFVSDWGISLNSWYTVNSVENYVQVVVLKKRES